MNITEVVIPEYTGGDYAISLARTVALRAHRGQTDKAGRPYGEHLWRVADLVALYGRDEIVVAWLHDILEDTVITELDLRFRFSRRQVDAVVSLTRRGPWNYKHYIAALAALVDPLARRVKIADITDHLTNGHKLSASHRARYESAIAQLKAAGG